MSKSIDVWKAPFDTFSSLGHEVRLLGERPADAALKLRAMEEWLEENSIPRKVFFGFFEDHTVYRFFFKKERDAIAFKLRFE